MNIDLDKLKATAQHHIRRGDAMQMDPQVIVQLVDRSMGHPDLFRLRNQLENEWRTLRQLQQAEIEQGQLGQHPDDAAVDEFSRAMKHKLAYARFKGRGGWERCPPGYLSAMLHEHVAKGDPVDVANFCMFLWHLGARISNSPPQKMTPEQHAQFTANMVKALQGGSYPEPRAQGGNNQASD